MAHFLLNNIFRNNGSVQIRPKASLWLSLDLKPQAMFFDKRRFNNFLYRNEISEIVEIDEVVQFCARITKLIQVLGFCYSLNCFEFIYTYSYTLFPPATYKWLQDAANFDFNSLRYFLLLRNATLIYVLHDCNAQQCKIILKNSENIYALP